MYQGHSSLRLFVQLAAALLIEATGLAAPAADSAVRWTDFSPEQIVPWENPDNWDAAFPNAPGVEAVISVPGLSKYVELHGDVTVGTLRLSGAKTIGGGILSTDDGLLRFDNGEEPALLDYTRSSWGQFDAPVEFQRDLVVRTRRDHGCALFFGPKTMFTPLCPDGAASIRFDVNGGPGWGNSRMLERRAANAVLSYIEDSPDGAPLSVHKDGEAMLVLATADNAFSGGTFVDKGQLVGLNGDGMDPPFLPFGKAPKIVVAAGASLQLRSSVPGVFGPGAGYALDFAGNALISIGNARLWNGAGWKKDTDSKHRFAIDSLTVGGDRIGLGAHEGAKLLVAGEVSLASNTVVSIWRETDDGSSVPDLDLVAPVRVPGGEKVVVRKSGTGRLRLGADNDFAGFACLTGSVVVASDRALGVGAAAFAPQTEFLIEKPGYAPLGKIHMSTNSTESWLDPRARFGGDPDAKEGWRVPRDVNLGIGADLRGLSNKTLVMDGGRLHACRNHNESPTNGFALGPGITIYTLTNLIVGIPNFPERGDHRSWERMRASFRIDGPLREHGGSWALEKRGGDRVELGGISQLTGGTHVLYGILGVRDTGRLGEGGVVVGRPDSQNKDVQLVLRAPGNLPEGTVLEIHSGARVILEFDGEATIAGLRLNGKDCEPGVWGAEKKKGVDHLAPKSLGGRGRIRLAAP